MAEKKNVMFGDGTGTTIPEGATGELAASYRAQLQEMAKAHGGFDDISIEEYRDLLPEDKRRTITVPTMPNPFAVAKGAPLNFTRETTPLAASNMLELGTETTMEEGGRWGLGALTALKTKSPTATAAASVVGSGLGNMAAQPLINLERWAFGLPPKNVSPQSAFAEGALPELAGRGIARALKGTWRGFRRGFTSAEEATKRYLDLLEIGVKFPEVHQATMNPWQRGIYSWLSRNWNTSNRIRRSAAVNISFMVDKLKETLQFTNEGGRVIRAGEPARAGRIAQKAYKEAPRAPRGWRTRASKMYSDAESTFLTKNPTVVPQPLYNALKEIEGGIDAALSIEGMNPQARRMLKSLEARTVNMLPGHETVILPEMPLLSGAEGSLRDIRSHVGVLLRRARRTSDTTGVDRVSMLEKLYKGLTDTLEEGYRVNDPSGAALKRFREADSYYKGWVNLEWDYLEKIAKAADAGSGTKMMDALGEAIRNNEIDTIAALRAQIGDAAKKADSGLHSDAWNAVTDQYIFDRVLTYTDEPSPYAFMNMMAEMSPQMKRVVFRDKAGYFEKLDKFFREYLTDINIGTDGVDAYARFSQLEAGGPLSMGGRLAGSAPFLGAGAAAGAGAGAYTQDPTTGAIVAAAIIFGAPELGYRLIKNSNFMEKVIAKAGEPAASLPGFMARIAESAAEWDADERADIIELFGGLGAMIPEEQPQTSAMGNNPTTLRRGR